MEITSKGTRGGFDVVGLRVRSYDVCWLRVCQPAEPGFVYWSYPVLFPLERGSVGAAPGALWRAEGQSTWAVRDASWCRLAKMRQE